MKSSAATDDAGNPANMFQQWKYQEMLELYDFITHPGSLFQIPANFEKAVRSFSSSG